MADISPPLLISVNSISPSVNLQIGSDPLLSPEETLTLTGSIVNPFFELPGSILNPVVTPEPENIPPLPDYLLFAKWKDSDTWDDSSLWFEGGINNPFDHLQLPRLQNKPSKVFNLNIFKTKVLIEGIDYTKAVYSLDWQTPINGVSQGSLLIKETLGVEIDPEINGITQGKEVEIYIQETPTSEELLTRCYVLGYPSLTLNQEGTYELSIELGDELALLSNTTRNRSKYCGLKPKTTQELANIYANLNGLKTRIFPTGHAIQETSTNNFLTETPHEFLSKIYSPVNKDVRTTENSLIIVPTRKGFDPERALNLSYKDVIQSQNNFSQFYETYTTVKASNDFPLELPFDFITRSYTQVNGNPENTKPWFQGGYQEMRTTITSLGDTDIYSVKETYGYIPLEATPWDKALVDSDLCAVGGFTTYFDVIEREVKALTYYAHPSGTKVVTKEETWVNGLKTFQIKDEADPNFEDTDLYNGILSYEVTTYINAPQVNVDVCEKDYQLLSLNIRTETYGVDKDFNFVFNAWVQETYSPSGSSSTLGQESYTGAEVRWTKNLVTGEFSEEDQIWVIQPPINTPNTNPPQAKIIKPVVENITNFSQFQLIPGSVVEPRPLSAPYCYNKEQLDTISERYLREQYGLSKAIVIVMPWREPITLNDSIYFTNRLGQTNKYLVWDIEINITLTQCTKTLTLLRWYE